MQIKHHPKFHLFCQMSSKDGATAENCCLCPDRLCIDERAVDDEVIRPVFERIVELLNGDVRVETLPRQALTIKDVENGKSFVHAERFSEAKRRFVAFFQVDPVPGGARKFCFFDSSNRTMLNTSFTVDTLVIDVSYNFNHSISSLADCRGAVAGVVVFPWTFISNSRKRVFIH